MILHALVLVLLFASLIGILQEPKNERQCGKLFCNFKCIGVYIVVAVLYLSESEDIITRIYDLDVPSTQNFLESFNKPPIEIDHIDSLNESDFYTSPDSITTETPHVVSSPQTKEGTLKIITVTSPRRAHPNIRILNLTIHALYQFYPHLEKYRHVISLDGCPKGHPIFWEAAWCDTYDDFYKNLKEEVARHSYFRNVEIIIPQNWNHRYGLGGTIKHAFDHIVEPNDIVFIQQGDMMVTYKGLDWEKIVSEMKRHDQLEYIRLLLDCVHETNMWEYRWEKHHDLMPEIELPLWQTCNWADHSHFVKPRVYYKIFDTLEEKGILYQGHNAPETLFNHTQEYCFENKTRRHFMYGDPGFIVSHLDGSFWDPKNKRGNGWRATQRVKDIVNGNADIFKKS